MICLELYRVGVLKKEKNILTENEYNYIMGLIKRLRNRLSIMNKEGRCCLR